MTTPINIKRPIVNANGTLTRWGWEVLQSFWNATGGNTPINGNALQAGTVAVFHEAVNGAPVSVSATTADGSPVFVPSEEADGERVDVFSEPIDGAPI